MKECETCLVKTTCDVCGKRLGSAYQMPDDFPQRMRTLEGHYHIAGKVICVGCYASEDTIKNESPSHLQSL